MQFNKVEFSKAVGFAEQLPPSLKIEVAFCGRSNVGKSSLLNKICNRKKLAKVSGTPGKTTTINFFTVNDEVDIVDLPGYGYAKRSESEKIRWSKLMEEYFTSNRNIAIVLLLLDSRHKISADDKTMLDFLDQTDVPFIAALTKVDKLKKSELKTVVERFHEQIGEYYPVDIIPISSEVGTGIGSLIEKIVEIIYPDEAE